MRGPGRMAPRIDGNQRVLVTGGSTGIGRELALAFRARGARVLVCSRSESALSELRRMESGILTERVDVSLSADRRRLLERAAAEFGGLDLLVNNAAVQAPWQVGAAGEEATASFETEIAINLTAPIALCAAARPLLRTPGGVVVNITSVLAYSAKPSAPVYCATKAALRSFTDSLRIQWASSGIRVVEIVPPLVDTRMTTRTPGRRMPAADAASAILAGLETGRDRVTIGAARPALWLHRLAPGVLARMMSRS